jgi:hypothetical protein
LQRASVASYYRFPSSPILVSLMMDAIHSTENPVLAKATRRNITGEGILHSHLHAIFKSCIGLTGWAL